MYMIRFTDNHEKLSVRVTQQKEHSAWMERQRERIIVAGVLRHDAQGAPVGAVWIVEAPSHAAVEALYKSDPFYLAGLRRSVDVAIWTRCWTTDHVTWADLLERAG